MNKYERVFIWTPKAEINSNSHISDIYKFIPKENRFEEHSVFDYISLGHSIRKCSAIPILLELHSLDKTPNRPDVCIGYNETISDTLKNKLLETSSLFGKVLKFNTPFIGAMTVDTNVKYTSFMIEVNKKNYLVNNEVSADAYKISFLLQRLVDNILEETK